MNVIKLVMSDNCKSSENFESARSKRDVVMMEMKMMRNYPYGMNFLKEGTVLNK